MNLTARERFKQDSVKLRIEDACCTRQPNTVLSLHNTFKVVLANHSKAWHLQLQQGLG